MLDDTEREPEMDCETDYRRGSSHPSSSSLSSSSTSATTVSKECEQQVKPDSNGGPPFRTGRWTPDEKILFLYGLKMFGKGRWKKMSVYLPQRSLVQIKSHAQKVLKRQQAGENIFRRLEENCNEIDNLVVQAARQRDALRMAGINVNTPASKPRRNLVKNSMKKKRLDTQMVATKAISPMIEESLSRQPINNSTIPMNQTADSSVLAAAALCQLSSIGGTWDQRDNSTIISGKSQQTTI